MIVKEKYTYNNWGNVTEVVTTYENGEKYYMMDGEKFAVVNETKTFIDDALKIHDITVRAIIPVQTIKVIINV